MLIVNNLSKGEKLIAQELDAGETVFFEVDDGAVLRRLEEECGKYNLSENGGRRIECWLLVGESFTLWMLQSIGVPEAVREKADVFAVTIEDLMAKTALVRLPNTKNVFPPLDREPIGLNSDMTVHLVVAGFSPVAEALAINAALVAHYPNYCRDTNLRTRITFVSKGVLERSQAFIQRYSPLFDNSYYRALNLENSEPRCILHRPMYEGKRKDFVDVEWEFVEGDIRNDAVRQKLKEWSTSRKQQLTIAICNDDQSLNLDESISLPDEVYDACVPVICNVDDSTLISYLQMDKRYMNLFPFGRDICSLDTLRLLKKLAKGVSYAYNYAFALGADEAVSAPALINEAVMEEQWNEIGSLSKLYSNVFNAMTLGTKMHSIGHNSEDWKMYYALSKEEIGLLMEVEHNRWNVEELILGYRPVTDDEEKLITEDISLKRIFRADKIHYDLRSYGDLQCDGTRKNVNVYDYVLTQSIPLIIKKCIVK